MTEPVELEISGVTKLFDGRAAVSEVSLSIRRGEFFSILGASGCGKSTLLRMIGGFERPDSGDIRIRGASQLGLPPERRPTNMVFQNFALFPHLNVADNIAYGLRSRRTPRAELRARVGEALRAIRMEEFAARMPHQLSGGQRQRVALARALVNRPSVLLLDEPFGALDKSLREEMQGELLALQRASGVTFVFVTHDQEEALGLSDRIAVMFDGCVHQVAEPERLYERPVSLRVARFIGDMNFFDGRIIEGGGDRLQVECAPFGRVNVERPGRPVQSGAACQLAIRPEKFALRGERPGCECAIVAVVRTRAYWGDQTHYQVELGDGRLVTVARQSVAEGAGKFDIGNEVRLEARPSDFVVLLDE